MNFQIYLSAKACRYGQFLRLFKAIILLLLPLKSLSQTVYVAQTFSVGSGNTTPSGWTVSSIPTGGTTAWGFTDFSNNIAGQFFQTAFNSGCDSPAVGMGELGTNDQDMDGFDDYVNFAHVVGDNSNNTTWLNVLESPAFNASGATQLVLEFDAILEAYATLAPGRFYDVRVEVFNGVSWVPVYTNTNQRDVKECNDFSCTGCTTPAASPVGMPSLAFSKHHAINILSAANGATNTKIRFRAESNGFFLWAIDNVLVTDAYVPLPVCMSNLSGEVTAGGVQLSWDTDFEQNNLGFEIQCAKDARNYVPIDFVKSKATNGTSYTRTHYAYTDSKPYNGQLFYRLQQMDKDGATKLSSVACLSWGKLDEVGIHPNPTRQNIFINLPYRPGVYRYSITNMIGIECTRGRLSAGENAIKVTSLKEGVYYINVFLSNTIIARKKILIQ